MNLINKDINNIANIKNIFDNDVFYYIFLKAEKIVIATYFISDLFPENEPLKKTLRSVANMFLDDVFNMHSKNVKAEVVISDIIYFQTIYNLGLQSRLISLMNHQIIIDELNKIKNEIEIISNTPSGIGQVNITKSFFKTKDSKRHLKDIIKNKNTDIKGQVISNKRILKPSRMSYSESNGNKIVLEKSSRIDKIMSFIKKEGSVSIKDISNEIPEVSEKTIQRDLMYLIDKGLLNKKGERRWSKYELV